MPTSAVTIDHDAQGNVTKASTLYGARKPDVQAGFRKGRGTQHLIVNIRGILECSKEFWKKISLCFIDHSKAFDYMDCEKLWVALKEMGVSQHSILNPYCGQEATVRKNMQRQNDFLWAKGRYQERMYFIFLFV